MTTIKASSKRGQDYLAAYNRSRKTSLRDCYASFSTEKSRAERDLRIIMNETGGEDFRILSASRFFFTCGWRTADGDLRVETVSHTYIIKEDEK